MNQLQLLSQFNLVSFFILGLSLSVMLVKGCYPLLLFTDCFSYSGFVCGSVLLSQSHVPVLSSLSGNRRHERRYNWEVWGLCQVEALVSECRRCSSAVFYGLPLSRWI